MGNSSFKSLNTKKTEDNLSANIHTMNKNLSADEWEFSSEIIENYDGFHNKRD